MIKPHNIFNVFQENGKLFTRNISKGASFEERVKTQKNEQYRQWDPSRSKLAAMIKKGCQNIFIRENQTILYLGIAHGYTASFVSDMIGKRGYIFGIDPAPRVMRDCYFLAQKRKNIIPILEDANHPKNYLDKISQVDIVYQDIAQKNQAEIFIKNINFFLKEGGYGLLAVKAKSIDISKPSHHIFKQVREKIDKHLTVVDFKTLEPYQKDHCMIICKKKSKNEQEKDN